MATLLTTTQLRESLRVTHPDALLAAVLSAAGDELERAYGEFHPAGTTMTCVWVLDAWQRPPVRSLAFPRPVASVAMVTGAPPPWRLSGAELLAIGDGFWGGTITAAAELTDERPERTLAELDLCRARLTGEGDPRAIVARVFGDGLIGWGRPPDRVSYDRPSAPAGAAYAIGTGVHPQDTPPSTQTSPHLTIPAFTGMRTIWIYSSVPARAIHLGGFDQTEAFRPDGDFWVSRQMWDGGLSSGQALEVVL